jgi:ankyrin repeat protein
LLQLHFSPAVCLLLLSKTPLLQRLLEHMEANWDPEEVVKMVNTPLTREPRGWCPLHIAASGGQLQAVRVLLEPGKRRADVHFSVNTPALHLAAFGGHKDVCQLLLDAGADVSGST